MRAVYLHGYGGDRLTWLGTLNDLREIENITPDLRGHGSAVAELNDGSLADLAEGVLEQVGEGEPAWLVGHSLGGGIALWLAAHYPERWKGLVLLAPLGLGERLNYASLERYPDTADEAEMMRFLQGLVWDTSLIKPEFATYAMAHLEKAGSREAFRKIVKKIPDMAEEVQGLLPKVAATGLDVTVFWGQADRVTIPLPEQIEKVGQLIELPDIGHIVHVEAMREINGFLRERFRLK